MRAEAEEVGTGARMTIDCAYLIGCDGAQSEVRRAIGARFTGDAVVQRTQSTDIRAPGLIARMQAPPAWSTQSLNPRRSANIFAIDGRERWLVHNYLRPEETDFAAVDRDRCLRLILGVGEDFRYEVLGQEDWIGRRMLADRFRRGRVFVCGDAAHIWVPFAGYGMNAGIADAMNLSWMLAGVLKGWADPAILDAHEAERWPITEQVSHHAMDTAQALARARGAVPAEIEDPGPVGAAARAAFGARVAALNTPQYCCGGLNFGYFYDRSPIIAYDGEAAPDYTMDRFTPSTVPGCRAPHLWLDDGRSLYDALGADFTLLRFDRRADADTIADAAARQLVPLQVLDVAAAGGGGGGGGVVSRETGSGAAGPARGLAGERGAGGCGGADRAPARGGVGRGRTQSCVRVFRHLSVFGHARSHPLESGRLAGHRHVAASVPGQPGARAQGRTVPLRRGSGPGPHPGARSRAGEAAECRRVVRCDRRCGDRGAGVGPTRLMRVVLDSNILFSALISPHAPPGRIYQAWRQGRFDLVTCAIQLDEIRRASRYPKFRDILQPHRVGRMLNNLQGAIIVTRLPGGDEAADPDDAWLLALADAGQVQFLVTGDKRSGLLARRRVGDARIVTAAAFCEVAS